MTSQPDGADARWGDPASGVPTDVTSPVVPVLPVGPVLWWTAACTVAAAVLVSLTAYAGAGLLAGALGLVVLGVAWGWPELFGLPSVTGTSFVVAVAGIGEVVAVTLTDREPLLEWLALVMAGAVVLELLHELFRRDGRPRVVDSMTGTVLAVVVLGSLSSLAALPQTVMGPAGVLVATLPTGLGLTVLAVPAPGRIVAPGAVVVSTLVGGLLGGLVHDATVLVGLVVGLLCGAVAVLLHRLLSVQPAAGRLPGWVALALVPAASTGMVGYVALRLLVG